MRDTSSYQASIRATSILIAGAGVASSALCRRARSVCTAARIRFAFSAVIGMTAPSTSIPSSVTAGAISRNDSAEIRVMPAS